MRRIASLLLALSIACAPASDAAMRAAQGINPGNVAFTGGSITTGVTGLPTLLAQSFVAVSAPVDTSEDTLATITVPANSLGANGSLRILTSWTTTNSANSKTLRIRYSGGAGTVQGQLALTTSGGATILTYIFNRGLTNSQIGFSPVVANDSGGVSNWARTASAVDTTAQTTVVITGQKALNSETLTLDGYSVEVIH